MAQALKVIADLAFGSPPYGPPPAPWPGLTRDQAIVTRRRLVERYAPTTVNKMLCALRGVMRACRDLGLIDEAHYQSIARIEAVRGGRDHTSRTLSPTELASLWETCAQDLTASGLRDAALLWIFLESGLRREELIELNAEDFAPRPSQGARLHIRSQIAERDRWIDLSPPAGQALKYWFAARGQEPGPLLLPVDKGGTIRFRRLTGQAVYAMVTRLGERAGLSRVTTRDLRRTCVTRLITDAMPLDQIRERVGHLSWLTPATYQTLTADAGSIRLDARMDGFSPQQKPQTKGPPRVHA